MAEFKTDYYGPMDRQYHERIEVEPVAPESRLEEPIVTIGELGQTIPEKDPAGRFKNMIQQAQAAIRAGAGKLQLVLSVPPHETGMAGVPYGKEVREKLREVMKANEAMLVGVELPTSISNLSGYDRQTGVFNEEKRRRNLEDVKAAIKFVAETGGGAVDVLSWEYDRPINDASWNKKGKWAGEFRGFGEEQAEVAQLVDSKTGRIASFRKGEVQWLPIDPKTGKETKDLQKWEWKDFERWAEKKKVAPEKFYVEQQINQQIRTTQGWKTYYENLYEDAQERIRKLEEGLKKAREEKDKETEQMLLSSIEKEKKNLQHYRDAVVGHDQQMKNLEEQKERLVPVSEFAKANAIKSYAEAGIWAMQETHNNPTQTRPICVGPENGWPFAYGSHPEEFVELVKKSREEMAKLLTMPYLDKNNRPTNEDTGRKNPYYQHGMSEKEAEEQAKIHIKGLLDTGHMGMWLQHFHPELPWDKRVKKFNEWFKEQAEKIAKEGVVGGMQVVDSASGAHGHLPPGQGILPIKEVVKTFKEKGYSGFMVSEGHEEEQYNEGRILVQTWKYFHAPFERTYAVGAPAPRRWSDVSNEYFARQYAPRMMFGGYTPPFGEYKPWSEIPFE